MVFAIDGYNRSGCGVGVNRSGRAARTANAEWMIIDVVLPAAGGTAKGVPLNDTK